MRTNSDPPNAVGCAACGHIEPPSPISDNMARFTNVDDRTDGCLKRCDIHVPVGAEVRLCRRHSVLLERELTNEYGAATPYVQPLPHNSASVGAETRQQRARLTTWLGDSFLPPATLGPVFRLFGMHRARRVTVSFRGLVFSGLWLPDCQDLVKLKAASGRSPSVASAWSQSQGEGADRA